MIPVRAACSRTVVIVLYYCMYHVHIGLTTVAHFMFHVLPFCCAVMACRDVYFVHCDMLGIICPCNSFRVEYDGNDKGSQIRTYKLILTYTTTVAQYPFCALGTELPRTRLRLYRGPIRLSPRGTIRLVLDVLLAAAVVSAYVSKRRHLLHL